MPATIDNLRDELTAIRAALAAADNRVTTLAQQLADLQAGTPVTQPELDALRADAAELRLQAERLASK